MDNGQIFNIIGAIRSASGGIVRRWYTCTHTHTPNNIGHERRQRQRTDTIMSPYDGKENVEHDQHKICILQFGLNKRLLAVTTQ